VYPESPWLLAPFIFIFAFGIPYAIVKILVIQADVLIEESEKEVLD
jgi:hypothetical protein